MKKFLGLMMVLLFTLALSFQSCNKCSTDQVKPQTELATASDSVISLTSIENIIATDRQAMYMKFGNNYRWYETDMRLPYFLDSEDVIANPTMLVNIFQSIEEFDNGADTYVWKFQHFPDGTVLTDSIHGFWIENFPLNEDTIKLSYKDAFDRMMQANFPKPHSKNVVLRNPIGPIGVNAQWIFGNISEQIWVDAATGDVKNSNPAFPDAFKMPLGEWP